MMKRKDNKTETRYWRKATALVVVVSLVFTLIEPAVATAAAPRERINFTNRDSYDQLRKQDQMAEGGKLTSVSTVLGMVSPQMSPEQLSNLSRQYQINLDQQLKQAEGEDFSAPKKSWINEFTHTLTRISALHIGRRTIDLVRDIDLNSLYHKMPSYKDIMGRAMYMSMQRGILNNDYGESLFSETLADYFEIYDERWKLSDQEISRDSRRLDILGDLERFFYEGLKDYPQLGIENITFSIRKGVKVIGLDEQGNIDIAMLAPFIIKKKRYDYKDSSIPFANSSRSNEALFSVDVDLIDALVSLKEKNPELALKIMRAIPMREFKVQELYLGGMEFSVAHMDPSVLEIPGHEELETFLWQVAESKLEKEKKEGNEEKAKEPTLEDKIAETRAYIKYRWSDETLENYRSIVRQIGQGIVTDQLLEVIYGLRDVPGLGALIDQLYQSIQQGYLDERVVSVLYSGNELRHKGEEVISLNLNLIRAMVDIVTYNPSLDRFSFYSLNGGFDESKVKNMGELIDEILRSEEFTRKVDFLLDAKVDHYSDKLFKFLMDGKIRRNSIISKTDSRTLVELKTLAVKPIPHLSALHVGTLVDLVKMIYENHQNNLLLDQLMTKSFDGIFEEVVNRIQYQGRDIFKSSKWMESDIERHVGENSRVGTEILRLYLQDYMNAFNIPQDKLSPAQRSVVDEVQHAVNQMIDDHGAFEFLGIKKIGARVFKDRYLIKDQNKFILAFYTDDGWWKRLNGIRYIFRSEGELALGISIVNQLAQLNPIERRDRIHDLVTRELMARTLTQYDDFNPTTSYGPNGLPGFDLEFDRTHKIIDTYPNSESKSVVEGVLQHFPIYLTKESPRQYAALDIVFDFGRKASMEGYMSLRVAQRVLRSFMNQEKLLSLARDIVSKTIAPMILFGITLGVGLSGSALAFDGTIVHQSIGNWDPLLLIGGFIGASILTFIGGTKDNLKKSVSAKKDEVKTSIHKIAAILGESQILKDLFSFYQNVMGSIEEPGIRFLANIQDLKENPSKLEELKNFSKESSEEKGNSRPYQFVIVTDENRLMTKQDVTQFLLDNDISQGIIDFHVLILNQPFEQGQFNLQNFLDNNKDKLLKDGYAIRVLNNKYWFIVREIMKNTSIVNGIELLELNIKGAKITKVSA